MNKAIQTLKTLARRKSGHRQHRMAAGVLRGASVIAAAANKHYGHAEYRLAKLLDLDGEDVLVIRVRKSGELGMARPCPHCLEILRRRGCRRVYWTENDGSLNQMRLEPY